MRSVLMENARNRSEEEAITSIKDYMEAGEWVDGKAGLGVP